MPTAFNGNEWANRVAVPPVMNKAYVDGGRVRVKYFSWTTSSPTNGDTVNLCTIPAGAIVLGGRAIWEAMGGSCTLSIGITGTAAKYANAIDVSSAGQSDFANTAALNLYAVPTSEENIFATMGGANWANAKYVKGHILYAKD